MRGAQIGLLSAQMVALSLLALGDIDLQDLFNIMGKTCWKRRKLSLDAAPENDAFYKPLLQLKLA